MSPKTNQSPKLEFRNFSLFPRIPPAKDLLTNLNIFIYSEINKALNDRKIKMHQMHRDEALEAFKIWDNKEDKIKY